MVKAIKGTFLIRGGGMQVSFNMVFQGWKQNSRPMKANMSGFLSGTFPILTEILKNAC